MFFNISTDDYFMAFQIHAFAKKESSDSSFRASDIPVAAFGSRAHLEEKALASVKYFRGRIIVIIIVPFFHSSR